MNNVTILIQGPIKPILLESIPNYLRFGPVVLSTSFGYKQEEFDILSSIIKAKYNNFRLVQNHTEEYGWYNAHNLYRQTSSTLRGLPFCDTKYTIKVRSDEFFENLRPVIDKLSPDILVCSDFFYNGGFPYQISDHIIGGLTSDLRNTFELVRIWCECVPPHNDLGIPDGKWFGLNFSPVTEALIFAAYLRSKKILPILANSYLLRKTYSLPVDSSLLGKYYAVANCKNTYYTDENPEGLPLCI